MSRNITPRMSSAELRPLCESSGLVFIKMPGKHSRLFRIWARMRARCNKPGDEKYKFYGARGIKVCDEWNEHFPPFRKWALSNGYNDLLTIDRIDTRGDYSPENCRWVTMVEQNNNRISNVHIEYCGVKYTLADFARKFAIPNGVSYKLFWERFRKLGWPIEDCIKR